MINTDAQHLAMAAKSIEADGVNGDTMSGMSRIYFDAAKALNLTLALQPELDVSNNDEDLSWNVLGWGYWYQTPIYAPLDGPYVSRYKWYNSKHGINVCNRWERNHTNGIQVLVTGMGTVCVCVSVSLCDRRGQGCFSMNTYHPFFLNV